MATFQKTVSRGSRFNQIYVPKEMEGLIEAGDEVEVKLVRKGVRLHYSKGLGKLSEFKENLIMEIFSLLSEVESVRKAFVVGSFLTEKTNYNDIDVAAIVDIKKKGIEKTLYKKLTEKIDLRFHVVAIEEKAFEHLLKACPLTKSMMSKFACDNPVKLPSARTIDEKHLRFLLMMPQDLLHIKLSSRTFFDNIRRLTTIERFLKGKSLDTALINHEIKNAMNEHLYEKMRNNEEIEKKSIDTARGMIREKLKAIEKLIENGKKQGHTGTNQPDFKGTET